MSSSQRFSSGLLAVAPAFGVVVPASAQSKRKLDRVLGKVDDGNSYDRMTQGTGWLNAGGALQVATAKDFSVTDTRATWAPSLALCPSVQEGETVATLECSTSIDSRRHVWARNIVWGDNVVRGNTVHYNLPTWNLLSLPGPAGRVLGGIIVWGDDIVWGHSLEDNIVWGNWDNIVWGDDDNIVWGQSMIGPSGINGGVQR